MTFLLTLLIPVIEVLLVVLPVFLSATVAFNSLRECVLPLLSETEIELGEKPLPDDDFVCIICGASLQSKPFISCAFCGLH